MELTCQQNDTGNRLYRYKLENDSVGWGLILRGFKDQYVGMSSGMTRTLMMKRNIYPI